MRDDFVRAQLASLKPGSILLDAGCGSQRYRPYCGHLEYKSQDFGQYVRDEKPLLGSNPGGCGGAAGYGYGKIDYVGDIWDIKAAGETFDAILCTEVFEHIPYPIEALKEFSRLLKPGGSLILTAPSNSLRHMDPYFFYSGFSDRWYEKFLKEFGFQTDQLEPVGDYYWWMFIEIYRTSMAHSAFAKMALLPALLYYLLKRKSAESASTLCLGYHLVAKKKATK